MSPFTTVCCMMISGVCLTAMAQEMHCRTLHPDLSLLTVQRSQRAAAPLLRAAERRETLLNVVDLLIAYDQSARHWRIANQKGTAASFALARVQEMNACLANTGLDRDFSFRLVGVVEVDIDASRMNMGTVMDRLINGYGEVVAKGEWAKVTGKREEVGADIVSVLVSRGSTGLLGLGYSLEEREFRDDPTRIPEFANWAYNVSSIETAEDEFTLLHEIAHNMGCGHPDVRVADPTAYYGWSFARNAYVAGGDLGPQLFDYSSGYYFWVNGVGYFTIMGYNFGGLRADGTYSQDDRFDIVPYFSSPNYNYMGVPLGSDYHDNSRTLRETYRYVAQYRASVEAIPDFETDPEPLFYPKAATFVARANDARGNFAGIVRLTVGKTNARKKTSRLSAMFIDLDAKKATSSKVTLNVAAANSARLEFSKSGRILDVKLAPDGFTGALDGIPLAACQNMTVSEGWHVVTLDSFPEEMDGHDVCRDLLPTNEMFSVKAAKWMFAKPASVKFVSIKNSVTKNADYSLTIDMSRGRTNLSGLKLSFSAKTGIFRGSFKVHATNAVTLPAGRKPKLKKYTAKVTGLVVDGAGTGKVSVKKPAVQTSLEIK